MEQVPLVVIDDLGSLSSHDQLQEFSESLFLNSMSGRIRQNLPQPWQYVMSLYSLPGQQSTDDLRPWAHSKPNGTTRLERLRNFTWNGGAQAGPAKSPGAITMPERPCPGSMAHFRPKITRLC